MTHVALVPAAVGHHSAEVLVMILYGDATFSAMDHHSEVQLPCLHEGVLVFELSGFLAN